MCLNCIMDTQAHTHILELESTQSLERQAREQKISSRQGRVEYAARLFVSGQILEDACECAEVPIDSVRTFLHTQEGKELVIRLREDLDEEFKNLYADTIRVLREGLHSADPRVAQNAASIYLRHSKELKVVVDITAEDLVRKIMTGEIFKEEGRADV